MKSHFIHGHTYNAEFFPHPKLDEEDEFADATVVIKPPFDIARATGLLETEVIVGVEIEDYATTVSASVFDVSYRLGEEGIGATEFQAFELMKTSLEGIIYRLNEIESGNFPKRD